MKPLLKYFLLWLPMVLIAVGNGTLRDLRYSSYIGDFAAHQLSTFTLLVFFGFYIRYVIYRWQPASRKAAIGIGVYWLILTLVFEFGLGLASGRSFSVLLSEYNIVERHLWILVPLWILVAPLLFPIFKSEIRYSIIQTLWQFCKI